MLRNILRLSRLPSLVLTSLAYLLGAGIARYLGFSQYPVAFWLGLVWVLLICLGMTLLAEYFRPPGEPLVEGQTLLQREELRRVLLITAVLLLAWLGALTAPLLTAGRLTPAVGVVLALVFLGGAAYSLPPLRLMHSGYGELVQTVFLVDLVPVLAYLLQADELHRIVPAVLVPLNMLALATFLALGFPAYAADQKYARRSLVLRLGWERSIGLHNVFILAGYLFFTAVAFMGFPPALFWPVFSTLPLALLQIYWLNRIAAGAPPRWKLLTALALSLFGLAVYVLAFTFWTR